jgi:hypothetical protein
MFNSDFIAWATLKLMPMLPGGMTRVMLGTDPAIVRAADRDENARVQRVLDHLLPVGLRIAGMNFDVATADRAKLIVSRVAQGRLIVFPTGGHALVGHMAESAREGVAFLQAAHDQLPPN